MIYEENQERLGLEQDAVCTVRDVLEKVVTDYAILPAKPNMDEVKRALTLLEITRLFSGLRESLIRAVVNLPYYRPCWPRFLARS